MGPALEGPSARRPVLTQSRFTEAHGEHGALERGSELEMGHHVLFLLLILMTLESALGTREQGEAASFPQESQPRSWPGSQGGSPRMTHVNSAAVAD